MKGEIEKSIAIGGRELSYVLRKSKRARRVRLAVGLGGRVTVTTPHRAEDTFVEGFIREKAGWLFSKITYFEKFAPVPAGGRSHSNYTKNKNTARLLIEARVAHYNKQLGFRYNKISVRNQKTRWGSCSKRGNLNFNFRLLFLPDRLRDYVIVHELCHLEELNHSGAFWSLVEGILPEYRDSKKELRGHTAVN